MQRAVTNVARAGLVRSSAPRALVASRAMSTEGTSFSKKGKAVEEQYFRHLEEETKKLFSEKLLAKELKALVAILPENHNLQPEHLHSLLEWKHKHE
ncbi:Hypothetical Protein FCC1311_004232 [Hondaea fermentalgiana]|uniref:Uncharacterized protein n=1 Tax=Hondaea fermentalgiana TaxID=2315210 RepID=A0A2R5G104_9STRA|nr:Hypothetical Protein FCC1311_004232 [Hondaea fermentalgiana]|eukprot:GBG24205.1 Hypothetical Protein FCC1311_004232 [Hondaea fermentalgiana]